MTTVTSRQESEQLPLQLMQSFQAFGSAFKKHMDLRLGEDGISFARMRLLGALHCSDGEKIMSELSDELMVTPRNITGLVDALEQEGLVRRRPHATDRRAIVIELTPHGAETAGAVHDQHTATVTELFRNLSEHDQRELMRILDLLRASLQGEGGAVER